MEVKDKDGNITHIEWNSYEKDIEMRKLFFQGMFRNPDNTHLVCSSKVNLPEPGDNMYDYNGRYFQIIEIIERRDHKGFFLNESNRQKISIVKAIPIIIKKWKNYKQNTKKIGSPLPIYSK